MHKTTSKFIDINHFNYIPPKSDNQAKIPKGYLPLGKFIKFN